MKIDSASYYNIIGMIIMVIPIMLIKELCSYLAKMFILWSSE